MLFSRINRFFGSLREGPASRVIFYYPGEEATYLEQAHVILHKSGIVEIFHQNEQVTTHVQHVEIVWRQPNQNPGKSGFGSTSKGKGRSLSLVPQQPNQIQ